MPEVEDNNDRKRLVFTSVEGVPVTLNVDPESEAYQMIAQNRELRFTLWLTKWEYRVGSGAFFWCPEIETIEDHGKILYDARICPLHRTEMQRGEVEIHYGLPAEELLQAMRAQFSGGPGFDLGGCCPGPVKAIFGFRCQACIAAYEKWSTDHIGDAESQQKDEQPAAGEPATKPEPK